MEIVELEKTSPVLVGEQAASQSGISYEHVALSSLNKVILESPDHEPFIDEWPAEASLEWGKLFALVNGGVLPSERALDELSKKDIYVARFIKSSGKHTHIPPVISVIHEFGDFENYCQVLEPIYKTWAKEREQTRLGDLETLKSDVISGAVPERLFEDIGGTKGTEDERLKRWAKWKVIEAFGIKGDPEAVAGPLPESILKWCGRPIKQDDGTWKAPSSKRGFIGYITKYSSESPIIADISGGDIELTAVAIGLHDYVWPLENDLKGLRLKASPR